VLINATARGAILQRIVITEWDRRVAWRALVTALIALALVVVVTIATDEGGLGWGVRAGRALPLSPVCAAIGAWIALAPAIARGEIRGLEALGRSPWHNARAAALGAALVPLAAALAVALSAKIDVSGFFPAVPREAGFSYEDGAFVDEPHEWRVEADGAPVHLALPRAGERFGMPAHARPAAAIATAVAGVALPLVAGRRRREGGLRYVVFLGASLAASLLVFQAAAASLLSAWLVVLPPAAILFFAGARYRD
jgi:hypothetical protein